MRAVIIHSMFIYTCSEDKAFFFFGLMSEKCSSRTKEGDVARADAREILLTCTRAVADKIGITSSTF